MIERDGMNILCDLRSKSFSRSILCSVLYEIFSLRFWGLKEYGKCRFYMRAEQRFGTLELEGDEKDRLKYTTMKS